MARGAGQGDNSGLSEQRLPGIMQEDRKDLWLLLMWLGFVASAYVKAKARLQLATSEYKDLPPSPNPRDPDSICGPRSPTLWTLAGGMSRALTCLHPDSSPTSLGDLGSAQLSPRTLTRPGSLGFGYLGPRLAFPGWWPLWWEEQNVALSVDRLL